MSIERLAVSSAELGDLDLEALHAFVAERAPRLSAELTREDAAARLGFLTKVAARYAPSLVGLYVFGQTPQHHLPEWGVACVACAGSHLVDPVEERADLEGNLTALVGGALDFVRARCGGARSAEAEFDERAVREALVNALIHRDLRRPSRVALRVFVDRLEVWSPGGPPEGVADLDEVAREGGFSHARNPLLAATARQLGLCDQIGRGLASLGEAATDDRRVEIRCTPRDVLVVMPSRWRRPRAALS